MYLVLVETHLAWCASKPQPNAKFHALHELERDPPRKWLAVLLCTAAKWYAASLRASNRTKGRRLNHNVAAKSQMRADVKKLPLIVQTSLLEQMQYVLVDSASAVEQTEGRHLLRKGGSDRSTVFDDRGAGKGTQLFD